MFSLIFVCVCRENVQLWEKLPYCNKTVSKGFVNDNQNVYEFFQKVRSSNQNWSLYFMEEEVYLYFIVYCLFYC